MKKYLLIILMTITPFINNINAKDIITHVKITCYQPTKAQCHGNPLVTADGSVINLYKLKSGKIRWCAVSRDIYYLFPKEKPKRIKITGCPPLNGIWEVHDKTSAKLKHTVDILIHPNDKNRYHYKNVKIIILK